MLAMFSGGGASQLVRIGSPQFQVDLAQWFYQAFFDWTEAPSIVSYIPSNIALISHLFFNNIITNNVSHSFSDDFLIEYPHVFLPIVFFSFPTSSRPWRSRRRGSSSPVPCGCCWGACATWSKSPRGPCCAACAGEGTGVQRWSQTWWWMVKLPSGKLT